MFCTFRLAKGLARTAYFRACCWPICWLCSWKRSLTRCWVAIHLRTQRLTQPFSLVETALEVKSSTHEVKQCSTRPPNACTRARVSGDATLGEPQPTREARQADGERPGGLTYAHKLLDLSLLHALLQGALLGLR